MAEKSNRLILEKSPYLLQHAYNPVDWYPWGEQAFAKANEENKPIFLSVGYSTCHWCHVMAHESFENPDIAGLLNRWFVSVKVDREERPDIDHMYMTATQLLSGGGGWPLSVFLFPDGRPFYGGTYFPPHGGQGRPGLVEVLVAVHRIWLTSRNDLEKTSQSVLSVLRKEERREERGLDFQKVTQAAYQQLQAEFDGKNSGFGLAPKFPRPVVFNFLLRYWRRFQEKPALDMSLATLDALARGGIHDHLGGGFHRYSVDASWRVPHFEKMLYDQAQLANSYLDAYQVSRSGRYRAIAEKIFSYLLRDLRDPAGGFYSAEDADSVDPYDLQRHGEGAYYLWTKEEIDKTLGASDAEIFCYCYGVEPAGNVRYDQGQEFVGKNILYLANSPGDAAQHFGRGVQEVEHSLAVAEKMLLEKRKTRQRPHCDDKILTSWNGLVLRALARGSVILGNSRLRQAARALAQFMRERLFDETTATLKRRYRRGSTGLPGQLEDYAFLVAGLLELYQVMQEPHWLKWAVILTETQINLFWDTERSGFFSSLEDEYLPVRLKNSIDGAEPAGNSVAALNLLQLAELTGNESLKKMADELVEAFTGQVTSYPTSLLQILCALDRRHRGGSQVVVAGPGYCDEVQDMLEAIFLNYDPDRLVLLADGGINQEMLTHALPFVKDIRMMGGKVTAYVCKDFTCLEPVTDVTVLGKTLAGRTK